MCRKTRTLNHEAIYEEIPINHLVPGDIIVIPRTGFVVPCDAVLLSGNCIVNESMLTGNHSLSNFKLTSLYVTKFIILLHDNWIGESVPVTKTALPCVNVPYKEKDDWNHTLFGGTQVIQARYYANEHILAVVLKTGFLTAKGSLVRSIMYPVPHDFKFDQDGYKFVGILAAIAIFGCAYSVYSKVCKKRTFKI